MNEKWLKVNSIYWDEASRIYDSLYQTGWSRLENSFVKERLNKFLKNKKGNILDLGFGLGLGYEFILENQRFEYFGIDISRGMLEKCLKKYPKLNLSSGHMSDLSKYEDGQFDVIISIFSSFSYTDEIEHTLEEIKRVLRPNGVVFISVISRFSLRRLLKFQTEKFEKYKTRQTNLESYSNSWTFTKKELIFLFENAGFEDIKVTGLNSFASIFEFSLLWKLGRFISIIFPNLSHELILTAKFNSHE